MNRIILIGNGFDLAHGMKTTYQNFLDNYWGSVVGDIKSIPNGRPYENEDIEIEAVPTHLISGNTFKNLQTALESFRSEIKYKNRFLKAVNDKSYLENWVDIENEYYTLLKETFKNMENKKGEEYDIQSLNKDFGRVKNLLRDYLKSEEQEFDSNPNLRNPRLEGVIGNKIYYPFKLKDFSEESLNKKAEIEYDHIRNYLEGLDSGQITLDEVPEKKRPLVKRVQGTEHIKEIKKLLQTEDAINYIDLVPDEVLFLNFNYTYTERLYENSRKYDMFSDNNFPRPKFIHIHGATDPRDKNPIIFGFGDELDDDYKVIEKLNNNQYLENIKSINYLETENYRNLLNFVNRGNYQIYIFGHSCGTSDRTLLNTVFEHENCASIKVFYHKRKDNSDNYSDVVRNISRNFNDKAKMRDLVVNRTYCESLA